jgi:DNA-binding transcriptional LysR family regulator
MTEGRSGVLGRLPSLRSLYVFEAAARHLNMVRAAEELGLTQGALSRQIKSLEAFIGVPLFDRHSRGLNFTEAGDALWAHCQRAFNELQDGLSLVSHARTRQTLLVAVARSYSTRVLSHRVGMFLDLYPWIDLTLDGHRHLADLTKGEADVAIRVGDGCWPESECEKICDDALVAVISPDLARRRGSARLEDLLSGTPFLHFTEGSYWETWSQHAGVMLPDERRNIRFTESVMMIEAAEHGQGIAIARRSLVAGALQVGTLLQVSDIEYDDGVAYYLCYTKQKMHRETVKAFRNWLIGSTGQPAKAGAINSAA